MSHREEVAGGMEKTPFRVHQPTHYSYSWCNFPKLSVWQTQGKKAKHQNDTKIFQPDSSYLCIIYSCVCVLEVFVLALSLNMVVETWS